MWIGIGLLVEVPTHPRKKNKKKLRLFISLPRYYNHQNAISLYSIKITAKAADAADATIAVAPLPLQGKPPGIERQKQALVT